MQFYPVVLHVLLTCRIFCLTVCEGPRERVWVWWREEDIEVGKVLMQSPLRPLLGQDYYNFLGCIYIQCLEYIFRAFLWREANFYLVSCAARSAVMCSCVVGGGAGGEF